MNVTERTPFWLVKDMIGPKSSWLRKHTVAYSYDKLSPSIARGEVVGPVRNHVTMEEWGNMSQVFVGNGRASLPERLESPSAAAEYSQFATLHQSRPHADTA